MRPATLPRTRTLPAHDKADLTQTFDLVQRAQAGDNTALGRLLDRYRARVRRIVRLRLGTRLRNVVESEDVLQETFTQAIRAFDHFDARDEASLINWLCRIVENTIAGLADYHFAKRRNPARQLPLDADDEGRLADAVADAHPGPKTQALAAEDARLLDECIAQLPEQYREIIILRDFLGLGWEDVAREHGRPSADAARMMHAKALLELQRCYRRRTKSEEGGSI